MYEPMEKAFTSNPFEQYFHTGIVSEVNPKNNTCTIKPTMGDGDEIEVPIANTTGGLYSTNANWANNLRGAAVYYTFIDGQYYVLGTLPIPIKASNDSIDTSVTNTKSGGENPVTYGAAGGGYGGSRSSGQQPGDMKLGADGGANIEVLQDGAIVIKASENAQIILGAMMDFVRIVAREFQMFSDFGEIRSYHGSSGRTGFSFVGGASYGDEAMSGGDPTVHMYMGDTPEAPESRFGVRVNSPDGGDYGAIVMGKDGKLVIGTSKDALLSVEGNNETRVMGENYIEVDSAMETEIGQDEYHTVQGERHLMTLKKENHSVADDMNLQVKGQLNIGCASLNLTSYSGGGGPCELKCSSFSIKKA